MNSALTGVVNRRVEGWQVVFAAGAMIIAAYYYLLDVRPGWATAMFLTANSVMAVSCLVAAWRTPSMRPVLSLLAAAAMAIVLGDIYYYVAQVASPSIGDVGYVSSYPLTAAALLLVVRRRTPDWDLASAIDAAVVAVGAGYVIFAFVIAPTVQMDGTDLVRLVSVAYPVGDLMLIVVGARLMLGAGARTAPLRMIGVYLALKLTADTIYSITVNNGTYHSGSPLDALWMSAGFTMAAAVLHPHVRQMMAPSAVATPDASPGRLTVLAIAAVVAPTAMIVQQLRGADAQVLIGCLVCDLMFLLVMGRMAGLVRAQRHTAMTDGLTGMRSRRFFELALHAESVRATRSGSDLSLLMLDIDHFKTVNDTYGHDAGDRVLMGVAQRLSSLIRPGDVVARYGGEEFAVLLPGASLEAAWEVAERVRHGIAAAPIAVGDDRLHQVTVSVGISGMPAASADTVELVLAADRALYAAKGSGRDRVACLDAAVPV